MTRARLADTLAALAAGADPGHAHLVVEEAEISLPLIVRLEHGRDGPAITAHPPFSAFRAGFEPVVHRARLTFGQVAVALARPASPDAVPATPPASDAPV